MAPNSSSHRAERPGSPSFLPVADPAAGRQGISAFLVPTTGPGYRVERGRTEARSGRVRYMCVALRRCLCRRRNAARCSGQRVIPSRFRTSKRDASGIAAQCIGMARAAPGSGSQVCRRAKDLRQAHHAAPGGRVSISRPCGQTRGSTPVGTSRGRHERCRLASA